MTDQELLHDYLHGSDMAFAALVRRHLVLVHHVARRHVPSSDAEDITQAVFALLADKASQLVHYVSLAGWLHDATRYCCLNHIRLTQRRRKHEAEAAVEKYYYINTSPHELQAELREILDDALCNLSSAEREAVLLRYLENNSIEETATALSISPDAAAKRATRGINRLRQILSARGILVPAVVLGTMLAAESANAVPAHLYRSAIAAPHSATAVNNASVLGSDLIHEQKMAFWFSTTKMAIAVVIMASVGIGSIWPMHTYHRTIQNQHPPENTQWQPDYLSLNK